VSSALRLGRLLRRPVGTPEHGRWLLAPAVPVTATRRWYRGPTAVLETEFTTADGVASVIDFMPIRSGRADLVRLVVGRRGKVSMRMELVIRFDYGSVVPWVRRIPQGISAVAGPDSLLLRTPVIVHGEQFRTVAEFVVSQGERVPFDLTWSPSHLDAAQELEPDEKPYDRQRNGGRNGLPAVASMVRGAMRSNDRSSR
jgi:hypothetical protein